MTNVEVISFVASVASLILAIGAIWLSLVFFRMSSEALKATTEAAKGIASSVERLEKLFDKLYSDTFSMMRDTVSDMRKHIWPVEESEPDKSLEDMEKKADARITELKETMEKQLSQILQQQSMADDKVSALRKEMTRLIDTAIVSSRQVESEAREETIRENILRELRLLRGRQPKITANDLVKRLRDDLPTSFPTSVVLQELRRMEAEGLIDFNTGTHVMPETEIRFGTLPSQRRITRIRSVGTSPTDAERGGKA